MNANELSKDRADILADELLAYHNKGVCGRAAKMLRQQQAEIEALRNQLWDLKSEPWGFDRHPAKEQDESFDRTASHMAGEYVSYKDLTDEEIMELSYLTSDNDPIVFARAILRKAQEKC